MEQTSPGFSVSNAIRVEVELNTRPVKSSPADPWTKIRNSLQELFNLWPCGWEMATYRYACDKGFMAVEHICDRKIWPPLCDCWSRIRLDVHYRFWKMKLETFLLCVASDVWNFHEVKYMQHFAHKWGSKGILWDYCAFTKFDLFHSTFIHLFGLIGFCLKYVVWFKKIYVGWGGIIGF